MAGSGLIAMPTVGVPLSAPTSDGREVQSSAAETARTIPIRERRLDIVDGGYRRSERVCTMVRVAGTRVVVKSSHCDDRRLDALSHLEDAERARGRPTRIGGRARIEHQSSIFFPAIRAVTVPEQHCIRIFRTARCLQRGTPPFIAMNQDQAVPVDRDPLRFGKPRTDIFVIIVPMYPIQGRESPKHLGDTNAREVAEVDDKIRPLKRLQNLAGKLSPAARHVGVGENEHPATQWLPKSESAATAFTIPWMSADP